LYNPQKDRFECCNIRKTEAVKETVEKHKIDALIVGIRRDEHGIRGKERYFSPRDKAFKWNILSESNLNSETGIISMQDTELSGWNIFATDFGDNTNHVRVHPLLHWTEQDIWEYIQSENIPVVDLYFAKNGKRYRSIGCEPCCMPVDSYADTVYKIIEELKSTVITERSGRAQDKENEYNMQKLRSLGYM
jgi:sulfate adenylyltransferase subunit 2